MYIHHNTHTISTSAPRVVTIGSFDGVHKGHQVILNRLNQEAKSRNGESIVVTFEPHPRILLRPDDNQLELLNTLSEKADLLSHLHIDHLVVVPFTREFSNQSPQEYIEQFLLKQLKAEVIIIGYDHRFGRNREGGFHLLKEYSEKGAFELIQIEEQIIDSITVSSTKIRNAVKSQNMTTAHDLLSYPYRLTGTIVHGDHIGRSIGFPTANLKINNRYKLIPAEGIYAVEVYGPSLTRRPAMLYIGNRPTITSKLPDQTKSIEVNILNYTGDLYGHTLRVDLLKHIRNDKKFNSLEALKEALEHDLETTKSYFHSL